MRNQEMPLNRKLYANYSSTDTLLSSPYALPIKDSPGLKEFLTKRSTQVTLSQRMRYGKLIAARQRIIVDFCFVTSLLGIVLVVMDTELRFCSIIDDCSLVSLALKFTTTASTFFLCIFIIAYHANTLQQGVNDKIRHIQIWRFALFSVKWLQLFAELFICLLHPLPFLTATIPSYITIDHEVHSAGIPVNGVLTITVFLRLYLICRFFVVHSDLFMNTSGRSYSVLSSINIKVWFVIRTIHSSSPFVLIGSWMVGALLICSWNLRVCEVYTYPLINDSKAMTIDDVLYSGQSAKPHDRFPVEEAGPLLTDFTLSQSLWLTVITFLTVGYGDVVPRSACARVIVCFLGMTGVVSTALLVITLANCLKYTTDERYINTFVKAINLNKKKEQAAINVIKHAIQICILLRNGKSYTSPEMQGHRLALWRAARARRILEERQTRLWISRAGISEVQSGVVDLQESVDRIQKDQQYFRIRLDGFEKVILSLNRQIYDLKTLLEKSVLNKAA